MKKVNIFYWKRQDGISNKNSQIKFKDRGRLKRLNRKFASVRKDSENFLYV